MTTEQTPPQQVAADVNVRNTSPFSRDDEFRLWALRVATERTQVRLTKDEGPLHVAVLQDAQAYYAWLTGTAPANTEGA